MGEKNLQKNDWFKARNFSHGGGIEKGDLVLTEFPLNIPHSLPGPQNLFNSQRLYRNSLLI
ncbi:MAG TPA: hypothetical protein DEO60_01425 [Bacteroidales bacterium]|nr:hypothetical protein [Bacteroidales bacterium]HBZ19762.1 hypothetical protein [Bacteroidales bacterium]